MVVLMIVLGVALLYLELHFMTGILGILSVLCFALFFWARFLGGTAGWLEVTLFVLGLGCLALELFAIPGFGVFGVSGILLIIASLVLAGHTWTFDLTTNLEQLSLLTGQVMLSIGVVGAMGVGAARYLPNVPMFESMILGPPGTGSEAEPRLRPDATSPITGSGEVVSVGQRGESLTMLRPSGKARLNNRVFDVVSEGPFITPETQIEIVAITGNRIVVRQV
jgi:membrane-bound serine protease (ClpP class)